MAADRDDEMWLHARREISIVELADCCGLAEAEVRELVEYGALAPMSTSGAQWTFRADCLGRVRTAARLRNDLELETGSLALVLAFLERIDTLEAELRALSAQLQSPHD